MPLENQVAEHYTRGDLGAVILDALEQAGKDIDNLSLEDLAPIDEFHIRGRKATMELGRGLGLQSAMLVLDVGRGIGGLASALNLEHVQGPAWACRFPPQRNVRFTVCAEQAVARGLRTWFARSQIH